MILTISMFWRVVAVVIILLVLATVFLFGCRHERHYRDKTICRLYAEVKSHKAHARDMTNKYADAANEAARLKGEKHETPNQNQSHRRG